MLKQQIIQHYLKSDEIIALLPQHHGKALGLLIKYGGISIAIRIVHSIMTNLMTYDDIAGWISAILLAVTLLMFNYYFMLLYLDSIVITPQGIVIMDQVGLLDFSQTRFDWDSIQTIAYHQHGMVDRLLNKGDITIGIEHGTNYNLPNVVQPTKRVDRLNYYKHEAIVERARQMALIQEELTQTPQYDKFDLLVDKLSDIIVDYMQQPRSADTIIDGDSDEIPEDDYPQLYKG